MAVSRQLALALVFLWFFIGGIGHFVAADTFASIVPSYIPWPKTAVFVSGVFELAGAFGLLLQRFRRAAGCGLILLTACVTPANVYMWQNAARFPEIPPALLATRLVLQLFLVLCIAWASHGGRRKTALRE